MKRKNKVCGNRGMNFKGGVEGCLRSAGFSKNTMGQLREDVPAYDPYS